MGGSWDITQNHVDRIGKLLDELDKLPVCMNGAMDSDTSRAYQGLGSCSDAWTSVLHFTIAADGTVSGDGVATLESDPVCFSPGPSGPWATEHRFTITGTATETLITLRLGVDGISILPADGGVVAGFHAMFSASLDGPGIEVPRTAPCVAGGQVVIERTDLDSAGDLHMSTNEIRLGCAPQP